jgi:hypothetical protein
MQQAYSAVVLAVMLVLSAAAHLARKIHPTTRGMQLVAGGNAAATAPTPPLEILLPMRACHAAEAVDAIVDIVRGCAGRAMRKADHSAILAIARGSNFRIERHQIWALHNMESASAHIMPDRLAASLISATAKQYECDVEVYLRELGCQFKTEDELRRERCPLTPDFMFDTPILINGELVRWIDVKSYPAYDSQLVLASVERQVRKYVTHIGPGILIFNGGIRCNAQMATFGARIFDGSSLHRKKR